MTAQIDLDARREPAQPVTIAVGDEERGFGEVVLGRDRLHGFGRQPGIERTHRRGIAGKRPIGKRVDLIKRDMHAVTAYSMTSSARSSSPCGSVRPSASAVLLLI